MNQSCALPLGSSGATGRFDACPVWMVLGFEGDNFVEGGTGYIYCGEFDPSVKAWSNTVCPDEPKGGTPPPGTVTQPIRNVWEAQLSHITVPITMASPGDFYYLDYMGHAREMTLLSNGNWAPWNNADITVIAGAPPAAAGSQLTAYVPSGGSAHLFHVNSSQHVEMLWYNGNWNSQDVTASTGGPNVASGTPIAMAGPGDFYYLDSNGHVREITLLSNGNWAPWNNADITVLAGAPAAATGSQLTTYSTSTGNTYLFYINSSQSVEALWYNGNWNGQDLTQSTGGPTVPSGTKIVMASPGDFYYLDPDGYVRELTLLSNGNWAPWNNAPVTFSATPAAPGSQLTAYVPSGGSAHVFYINSIQHVEMLFYGNNQWNSQDVGATTGGPNAASGTPITMASPGDFYYWDSTGHVREMSLLSNGTWAPWTNSEILSGAPTVEFGSQLATYVMNGNTYLIHVNSNQRVQALWYNGNWNWQELPGQ